MKLLFCKECQDIIKLTRQKRTCECGATSGRYLDDLNVVYSGENSIPLGIANDSFVNAVKSYLIVGTQVNVGFDFTAFIIPKTATTIAKIKSLS